MADKKVPTGRAPEQDAVRRNAVIGDVVFFGLLAIAGVLLVTIVAMFFQ